MIREVELLTEDSIIEEVQSYSGFKGAIVKPLFNNRYALVRKKRGKNLFVYSLLSGKMLKINKGLFVNLIREKGQAPESYMLSDLDSHINNGVEVSPITAEGMEEVYKNSLEHSILATTLDYDEIMQLPLERGNYSEFIRVFYNEYGRIEYREIRHTAKSNGLLMGHFACTYFNDADRSTISKGSKSHIIDGHYTIKEVTTVETEDLEHIINVLQKELSSRT